MQLLNGCGGRTKKKYDITCRSEFLALQKNILKNSESPIVLQGSVIIFREWLSVSILCESHIVSHGLLQSDNLNDHSATFLNAIVGGTSNIRQIARASKISTRTERTARGTRSTESTTSTRNTRKSRSTTSIIKSPTIANKSTTTMKDHRTNKLTDLETN